MLNIIGTLLLAAIYLAGMITLVIKIGGFLGSYKTLLSMKKASIPVNNETSIYDEEAGYDTEDELKEEHQTEYKEVHMKHPTESVNMNTDIAPDNISDAIKMAEELLGY